MVSTEQRESLQNELRTKHICRFCLSQQADKLSNIYSRDKRIKSSAPLTVQIMACASMEIFSDDGMPQSVCIDCRVLFEHSYRFKQMCRKGETLLRQVPLTGDWPDELVKPKLPSNVASKPKSELSTVLDVPILLADLEPEPTVKPGIPHKLGNVTITRTKQVTNGNDQNIKQRIINTNNKLPKKILNANPAESPEPPAPKRPKKEQKEEIEDDPTTIFLNKVENDEELSIDDLHRFIEANTVEDVTHEFKEKVRPKLLNKSSVRILNKEANKIIEPQFSKPEIKCDKDGNVAIVTEILDPADFQNDTERNIKDAAPVETFVFPCPHCERSFPLRQLRDIHVVNHTRERSNPCQMCDKSFFSKYDLQKHMLTHTGDKPFKCSICTKSFTRSTLLHRHEKSHTDVPKYICLHCEKPFISLEEMEKHAARHTKKRPFQCSICNKSFAFKQGLERHFVIHSNDQPFPCHYCDQTFLTSSKLARHLTAHAGRRPYPCRFCSKSFLLSHHLTRHLRNHKSSSSSYECHSCQTVFSVREDLIRHTVEHTRLSLVCVLCRQQLASEEKVLQHINEHVASEAFGCEFCDLMFLSDETLLEHVSTEHAEDLLPYMEDEKKQQKNIVKKLQGGKNNEKTTNKRKRSIKTVGEEDDVAEDDEFLDSIQEYLIEEDDNVKNDSADREKNEMEIENFIEELTPEQEHFFNIKPSVSDKVEQNPLAYENEENELVSPRASKRRLSGRSGASPNDSKTAIKKESPPVKSTRPFAAAKTGGGKKASPNKTSKSNVIENEIEKEISPSKNVSTARRGKNLNNNVVIEKLQKLKQSPKSAEKTTNADGPCTSKSAASTIPPGAIKKNSPKSVTDSGLSEEIEMLLGDEKMVGQKISLTKRDAANMAKQGRLRIKDGKIVLSRTVPKYKDK